MRGLVRLKSGYVSVTRLVVDIETVPVRLIVEATEIRFVGFDDLQLFQEFLHVRRVPDISGDERIKAVSLSENLLDVFELLS